MGVPVDIENVRPDGWGVRHTQTFLLFMAMFLAFTMRANMSMAIVDMSNVISTNANTTTTNSTNVNTTNAEYTNMTNMDMASDNMINTDIDNVTITNIKINNGVHFNWSLQQQSMILSSFFWGYVVLQIPGGELAKRFGGKILITISIAVNSLISLLLPISAKIGDWKFVIFWRVLQGLTQAFMYPSMHHLVSQWIPLEEKGRLSTIIYAGGQLGIASQLIASGFIANAWGWQAIFYTNGALGLLWTAAYLFLGSQSPENSKLISKEELAYIQTSLGRVGKQKKYPTPFKKIALCLPFWAAVVAHCGQNWGFFTLMTEMPTYMSDVLHFNLAKNGMLSSLPYLAMFLLSFPMGSMTDLIIRRNWLSVSNTRKLFNSIGLWGPALALVGLSLAPARIYWLAVVMLVISVGINAGQYTGFMLSSIDMAPNFSSSLMGISNFVANIVSIIAPIVCGFIVHDKTNAAEWHKVFYLASGIYFFTNLFFILFATSTRQSWNEPDLDTDIVRQKSNSAH
ncbi:putative inorganic phosphate cotransporter isoform X2 [Maniola jurtina]|uniref:putative inorganic phosphate cotransporter isoform X2 n=1 Tax=Maniola jurtina TaxID=191418 RepID=UPI001E686754|nr:putative inorganic phosphate cotransporter isoform X2 [Maniola jurtina]